MQSFRRRIVRLGRYVESISGDWCLNIRTRGALHSDSTRGRNLDAVDYDTVTHVAIKKAIRLVRPGPDDVVYDVGCGKGRAVCHFARCRTRKVIGIEISEQLCEIARANVRRLRKRRSPVEIRHVDAALADVGEGTIYYFFHPFGETTLLDVFENLKRTHDLATEKVTIIYINAQHAKVFDQCSCFQIIHDYKRSNGQRVVIYRSGSRVPQMVTDHCDGLKQTQEDNGKRE
ncbi:MAG: class I SAM-dependent methyltransferase [Planctomycetota bacterium]